MKKFEIYQFSKIVEDIVRGVILSFPDFQTQTIFIHREIEQTVHLVRVKLWFYPEQKVSFHWLFSVLYCFVALFCLSY